MKLTTFALLLGVSLTTLFAAEKATPPPLVSVKKVSPDSPVQKVELLSGKFSFDLSTLPMVGRPEAPHVIVAMIDPGCIHSRNTHRALREGIATFPEGQVAVVYLPAVRKWELDAPIQRMLLAIWREKPDLWRSLMSDLISGKTKADEKSLRAAAETALAQPGQLDAWVTKHQSWADGEIRRTTEVLEANAPRADQDLEAAVPQVMVGKQLSLGSLPTARDVQMLIAKATGLKPDKPFPGPEDGLPKPEEIGASLTIVYNGAGENRKADDPKSEDPHATDLIQLLPQLLGGNSKNSKVILFSSDASTRVANAKATAQKSSPKQLTMFPASRQSFDPFMNHLDRLIQLKAELAATPECRRLMQKYPGSDVSRFIRVSIFVLSHGNVRNNQPWVPIWPQDSDQGTDREYPGSAAIRDADHHLNQDDFALLRSVFHSSPFFCTSQTCYGVRVCEMILPSESDIRSCYYAFGGPDTVVPRDSEKDEGFFSHVPGPSKSSFFFLSYLPVPEHYRWFLMGSGNGGRGGVGEYADVAFTMKPRKANPFDLIGITSAEFFAEKTIAKYNTEDKDDWFGAAGSDEKFLALHAQVAALIERRFQLQQAWLKSLQRIPEPLKEWREKAKNWMNEWPTGEGTEDSQKRFHSITQQIFRQSGKDVSCSEAAAGLNMMAENISKYKDSPILLGVNDRPLYHLAEFQRAWQTFVRCRESIGVAARIMVRHDEAEPGLQEMSTVMATYFGAYINAYFPDIMKDTLSRRLDTIQQAADLLRDKHAATGDAECEHDLRKLRDHLALSLDFPAWPTK